MKHFIFCFIMMATCNFGYAQNQWFDIYTDSTALAADYRLLITDFERQVQEVDPTLDLKGVTFKVVEAGGFYNPQDHSIHLNIHQTPQSVLDFLTHNLPVPPCNTNIMIFPLPYFSVHTLYLPSNIEIILTPELLLYALKRLSLV